MTSQLIGKYCKIFLKNKFCYTGTILSNSDIEVEIDTKLGLVGINKSEISTIVEQNNGGN